MLKDKIEKVLEEYIEHCCLICTDPSIKLPQESAKTQALTHILELIEKKEK